MPGSEFSVSTESPSRLSGRTSPVLHSGSSQTNGLGLGSVRASRTSFDIPDDPELFQHEQDEVHDVHLIPSVEPVVGIGRMRVMVVVPPFPQVEESNERVIARRTRSPRRTL